MYIGDTDDGSGLHHMVYEVVDNGIDEALAGHADFVRVKIHADSSVSVADNGRGIPVDIHEKRVSAAEVIMTQLHAGGKFDSNSYKVSGGLHGVGVSVVNALSVWLELRIWRDGKEHYASLSMAKPASISRWSGTRMDKKGQRCVSSPQLVRFQIWITLLKHSKSVCASWPLNSGVKIILEDERPAEPFEQSLMRVVLRSLSNSGPLKILIMPEPIYMTGERDDIGVEVAMWWNDSYHENVLPLQTTYHSVMAVRIWRASEAL